MSVFTPHYQILLLMVSFCLIGPFSVLYYCFDFCFYLRSCSWLAVSLPCRFSSLCSSLCCPFCFYFEPLSSVFSSLLFVLGLPSVSPFLSPFLSPSLSFAFCCFFDLFSLLYHLYSSSLFVASSLQPTFHFLTFWSCLQRTPFPYPVNWPPFKALQSQLQMEGVVILELGFWDLRVTEPGCTRVVPLREHLSRGK